MTIVDAIRERFPLLLDPPRDDICYATQNRQMAIKEISGDADLVIVVGSGNSSNSVRLVEVALEAGAKASYRVDDATEIDEAWLEGVEHRQRHLAVPRCRRTSSTGCCRSWPSAATRTRKAVHTAEESLIFALPAGAASRHARRRGSLTPERPRWHPATDAQVGVRRTSRAARDAVAWRRYAVAPAGRSPGSCRSCRIATWRSASRHQREARSPHQRPGVVGQPETVGLDDPVARVGDRAAGDDGEHRDGAGHQQRRRSTPTTKKSRGRTASAAATQISTKATSKTQGAGRR